jgi:hypothetical protein
MFEQVEHICGFGVDDMDVVGHGQRHKVLVEHLLDGAGVGASPALARSPARDQRCV